MGQLIRVILLVLVVVGGAVFIIYSLAKFVLSFNNPKSRLSRIIVELRKQIVPIEAALVPIDDHEIKELSYRVDKASLQRGFNPVRSGVIQSIYGENFIAYAVKSFKSKGVHVVMLKTVDTEYVYYIDSTQSEVYINGKSVALVNASHQLLDPSGTQIFAHLEYDPDLQSYPLYIGDKVVAEVNEPSKVVQASPRVFSSIVVGDERQIQQAIALVVIPNFLPSLLSD